MPDAVQYSLEPLLQIYCFHKYTIEYSADILLRTRYCTSLFMRIRIKSKKNNGVKRWQVLLYHRRLTIFIFLLALTLIIPFRFKIKRTLISIESWYSKHMGCYERERGVQWKPSKTMLQRRFCPPPNYTTLALDHSPSPNICITTLKDKAEWYKLSCRDFKNVNTFSNFQSYASMHGYTATDNSHLIDNSRPPAWSKIHAVNHMLDLKDSSGKPSCDWVWWLDADIVIMNQSRTVESFLPDGDAIHLLVTYDRKFIANSGSWLVRNSVWSRRFLEAWWNRRSFVRERGLSLSGDNAAFGDTIGEMLPDDHIAMVPRCQFNSFARFYNATDEFSDSNQDLFYYHGDLVAHASGLDQKDAAIQQLLNMVLT